MKPEDKVCSFEQAKRLNEFKLFEGALYSTTYRYYVIDGIEGHRLASRLDEAYSFDELQEVISENRWKLEIFPAPDVAELGILLGKFHLMKVLPVDPMDWVLISLDFTINGFITLQNTETEAQARADALIYLLNEKILLPENLKL